MPYANSLEPNETPSNSASHQDPSCLTLGQILKDQKDGKITWNASNLVLRNTTVCFFLQLVVHVGVSGVAKEITIEQQAHNDGYSRKDVQGQEAEDTCCEPGADNCIIAGLNMEDVCKDVNCSGVKAKAVISHDAGRYDKHYLKP